MQRVELIKKEIIGKSVLDIGFIQHSWKKHTKESWLHNQLKKYSKWILGMDYLKEDIIKLQELRYNCVFGNAENFELNRKFDVIFAGELIEHLTNPGLFLDSAKIHMHKDSKLLITTPNAFSLGNIIRIVRAFFGMTIKDNSEHRCWYDITTLSQLLESKGFVVEEIKTFYPERYKDYMEKIIPKNMKSKIYVKARIMEEIK